MRALGQLWRPPLAALTRVAARAPWPQERVHHEHERGDGQRDFRAVRGPAAAAATKPAPQSAAATQPAAAEGDISGTSKPDHLRRLLSAEQRRQHCARQHVRRLYKLVPQHYGMLWHVHTAVVACAADSFVRGAAAALGWAPEQDHHHTPVLPGPTHGAAALQRSHVRALLIDGQLGCRLATGHAPAFARRGAHSMCDRPLCACALRDSNLSLCAS